MNKLNHPSEQKLLAYLHGELDKLAGIQLSQHLDHCPTCQQLFESLLEDQVQLLPELTDEELKLSPQNLAVIHEELERPHQDFKIEKRSRFIVSKIAAVFVILFITAALLYNREFEAPIEVDTQNYSLVTQVDKSEFNHRYIISIQSDKKAPVGHRPQSLTVVLDTSRSQSRQSGFKLLENHLSGIMSSITDKDQLNVIINGTSPSLQEVSLAGLSNKHTLEAILEVRLSTRPDLIESIDYGYQYASKTYNKEAANSVILLSAHNKAGQNLGLASAPEESISFLVLADESETIND